MSDELVTAAYAARLVIAAKAQAYEEAIGILEIVVKYGDRALPAALDGLRAKHAALTAPTPEPQP